MSARNTKYRDTLGDMLKSYERRETDRKALPGLPVYARIDGRTFSNFTRGMARPYDERLSRAMVETTKFLVDDFKACIGYTQSDEISLVFLAPDDSELPFGGKIQKMVSTLAASATAKFLSEAFERFPEQVAKKRLPTFDCRLFELPTLKLAADCFLWRELDATKNAISMATRAYYGPREIEFKKSSEMQEMLFQKGVNFNDYPSFFKRGTFVRRVSEERFLTAEELVRIPERKRPAGPIVRSRVAEIGMPPFSKVTNKVSVIFEGAEPSVG